MEIDSNKNLENISENVKKKSISKKWFKFDVVSPTIAILRGSHSMSDKRFKFGSRGQQGAACSVIAIVLGYLCQPKEWTFNFIDQILKYGDKLFRISQARNRVKPGVYMRTKLIYPEFFIEDYKCWVCIEDSCVFGNLFSENLGSPDLTDGLQRFFKTNNSGVLTVQENSVAIWRYLDKGFLYFDPSSCNELGVQSTNGVACVVKLKSLNDLRDLFLNNINQKDNPRYCIDRVFVSKVKFVDQGIPVNEKFIHVDENVLKTLNSTEIDEKIKNCHQTEVNHKLFPTKEPFLITISNYDIDTVSAATFTELPGDRAILHGLTHELSDMYKGKGAQSVANCIAIFGMKKINPVKIWLRPKLDEILVLGDNLHTETKAKYPMIQSLTAADFNDSQIIVDNKKLFNDIDLITIVGTLHSKDPSILSLKQAIEEFFLVHKDGIIESSSMAVAIWIQDDYFYMFDPRECDANGVRMIANEKTKSSEKGKKKSTNILSKKIEGKCCVMRFPNIDTLAAHILNNVSSLKKNDRFIIRHISVMDDIPGTRMWNEFQPGETGRTWILQGNISNDAEEFEDESRGFQGIAMPIVALVKAIEIPPNEWTSEIIDQVIREGDAYFKWCVSSEDETGEEETEELTLKNLKTKLYVNNRRVIINIEELLTSGRVKSEPDIQVPNLTDGLKKFFENHQYGIIELNDLSVAVWKHEIKNKSGKESEEIPENVSYYCFDPNPRGKLGHKTPQEDEELVACVVRAVNLEEIARIIELNIDEKEEVTDEFFIHGFKVDSISEPMTDEELIVDKKIPIRPDLNNYSELSEEVAYLAGSFTQANSLQFKSRTRNKQQAANALVALAMSKLYNPHLWYQEVVDDILKLGDKITEENLDNLPEEEADIDKEQINRDYLVPSEINESFDIGVNRAIIEIEEGIISELVNNIDTSVTEFFRTNQMGILRQDEIMLPIWKEGHTYFTFNPRGTDDQVNLKEENNNTAMVYWSTTISSLVMIIKQFLKPDKNFTIDGIALANEYETRIAEAERPIKSPSKENLWNNFVKISDGIWKLVGNIAIDDDRFEEKNRNNQTAAIAIISVLFSKIYEARQWNTDILNEIVTIGDQLHSKSAERLGDNINLKVNQIIPEFFFSDRKLDLTINDCIETGKINQNMLTGLEIFFNKYVSGILTIAGINLAIWKATDIYYCIIPGNFQSPNNDNQDKNITVYRFQTLQLLINYLMNLFDAEEDYEMHAVDVIDWNKLPPWKFDPTTTVKPSNLPSLNAFKRFQGYARAILRGGIHQGSNIFPEAIRNQQTAANCVVALAMTLVKNPVTWTRETMDEILVIGLNVHQESLKSESSSMKLKPSDIIRVFQVGENVIIADIEAKTITGQVSLSPPEPEVKGKKAKKAKKAKPTKAKGKKKQVQKRVRPPPPPPILLREGLKKFFDHSKAGVLVVGHYMIALWKDQGVYFIYDPSGLNDEGEKDDLGASCTMWFAYLEPLYDLIYMNIDESDKYMNYEICQAIIRTTIIEPLPNPVGFQSYSNNFTSIKKTFTSDLERASEFYYIDKEVSILLGNIHMGDESFDVSLRGFQSTAIAAIAIVMSLLHVPSTWTAELIDSIIKYGNILNQDSMRMVRSGSRTLSPCELLDVFIVGDFRANIYIHRHTTAGILLVHDLAQALTFFFKNNCAGILHTPDIAVAVMQHYGKFYMLDPRECDKFGRLSYDGTACVTKWKNIMRLASQFVNNCNYKVPCVYTINAVEVLNLQFFSDTRDANSLK